MGKDCRAAGCHHRSHRVLQGHIPSRIGHIGTAFAVSAEIFVEALLHGGYEALFLHQLGNVHASDPGFVGK